LIRDIGLGVYQDMQAGRTFRRANGTVRMGSAELQVGTDVLYDAEADLRRSSRLR